MTTAMSRRLANLEHAVANERPKKPVHIELVALDDEDDGAPREPWVPGSVITRIYLVPLKPTGATP